MRVSAPESHPASTSVRLLKLANLSLLITLIPASVSAKAQSATFSQKLVATSASRADGTGNGGSRLEGLTGTYGGNAGRPFSRLAFGGGVSPLGVNFMAATNLNRYMNLRLSGNTFEYTVSNISTNGFNVGAALNLASMGASADIYPFPNHGLRFSPGVLIYNSNAATATFTVQSEQSFTLDNMTYYSSSANPVTGSGTLGLNSQKPAFTLTTGWGNVLRRSGHISFPFEIGAAFIGTPSLNIILNSGQVCDAQGSNCVNVATDATVQSNLQQQVAKYKNDLSRLKTFPIVSMGVSYSFRIR